MSIEQVFFLPFNGIHTDSQSVIFDTAGALDPHREPARDTAGLTSALKSYAARDKGLSIVKSGAMALLVSDADQWQSVKQSLFTWAKVSLTNGVVTAINLADAPGLGKSASASFAKGSEFGTRHVVSVQPGLSNATVEFLRGARHVAKVSADLTSSGVAGAPQGNEYVAQAMKSVQKASDFIRAAAAQYPDDGNLKQAAVHIMSAVGYFRMLESGTPDLNGDQGIGNFLDPPNSTQTEVNSARSAFVVDTNLLHAKSTGYRDWDNKIAVTQMFKGSRLRRHAMPIGR
jgi:hypothetical protein